MALSVSKRLTAMIQASLTTPVRTPYVVVESSIH